MGRKPVPNSTSHLLIAVVMRVREGSLETLFGRVERQVTESLEDALARAVELSALTHVEQLETQVYEDGTVATIYLGLARGDSVVPGDWRARVSKRDAALLGIARARLRAKLSYTNLGFALAPEVFTISELREVYVAALGHDVSATNLQRVLLRRGALERVEGHRAPGRTGGRPAALFRFASQRIEVTDEFAALRPPR
jgi:ADP-ribose pyrophosphatase YjhB (NUDIX family)